MNKSKIEFLREMFMGDNRTEEEIVAEYRDYVHRHKHPEEYWDMIQANMKGKKR